MHNKNILCGVLFLLSAHTFHAGLFSNTPKEIKIGLSPEFAEDLGNVIDHSMKKTGSSLPHVNPGIISLGHGIAGAMKPIQYQFLVGMAKLTALSLASTVVFEATKKYIGKYLFEPALIEKRSSSWITQKLSSLFKKDEIKIVKLEDHMIISDQLSENLNYIMNMTKNIKKNGGQFENVLLHGEPGTGKTLFAKLLAEHCGMAYAFIPAANVSQFLMKGTAVQELNELFTWAASNDKGTILFFDEAETFLAQRSTLTNEAQNALAAFLAKTGTPSDKIMIICATNRPEIMDSAVLSRLGFRVEFPLPDLKAREAQLAMHIKNTFEKQQGTQISYDYLQDPASVNMIAQQLEGCSGRSIQKAVNRFRQAALAQDVKEISKDIVERVIQQVKSDGVFAKSTVATAA